MTNRRKRQSAIPVTYRNPSTEPQLFKNINNGVNNVQMQDYQYGSSGVQKNLPLPSQSTKIPYRYQPTRFINANQQHRQIDYLKSKIEAVCQLEELHYQAKIAKVRQENLAHREKLQNLITNGKYNPALFDEYRMYGAIPISSLDQEVLNHNNKVSKNNEPIRELTKEEKLQKLLREKQKIIDEIDKVKMHDSSAMNLPRRIRAVSTDSDSSDDNKAKTRKKLQERKSNLDYIYERNQHDKKLTSNAHFQKKANTKQIHEAEDKRKQYEWVKQVRKLKQVKFLVESDPSDSNSSQITRKSVEKSNNFILDREQTTKQKSVINNKPLMTNHPQTNQNMNIRNTYGRNNNNTNGIGIATKNVLHSQRESMQVPRQLYRTKQDYDDRQQAYIMQERQRQRQKYGNRQRYGDRQRQRQGERQRYENRQRDKYRYGDRQIQKRRRSQRQTSEQPIHQIHYIHPKLIGERSVIQQQSSSRYSDRRSQDRSYYSNENYRRG